MAVKTRAVLKTYFNTGDRPTEQNFIDLIDSFAHESMVGVTIVAVDYNELTGNVDFSFSDNTSLNFPTYVNTEEPISFITGLQSALDGKVTSIVGFGLTENNFTNALLTKLNGLQNYTHPASHEINFITGLQTALNEKANDATTVKSINGITPDGSGDVAAPVGGFDVAIKVNVSGTYEINWNAGSIWDLTMTANTVITQINMPPLGIGKVIIVNINGEFSHTKPAVWGTTGDAYDGINGVSVTVASWDFGNYHSRQNSKA